jgi:hypothetical protein
MTITAAQLSTEIDHHNKEVTNAIKGLEDAAMKKVLTYHKKFHSEMIVSTTEHEHRTVPEHKSYVEKQCEKEKLAMTLAKELLKVSYEVLRSRRSQLSAIQTKIGVWKMEFEHAMMGPGEQPQWSEPEF